MAYIYMAYIYGIGYFESDYAHTRATGKQTSRVKSQIGIY